MRRIFLSIIIFFNFLYSAQVEELNWSRGETFLTFLEKYSIPQKLYFDLEKEDQELCSEITADRRFYLYTDDDGKLNQVLIPRPSAKQSLPLRGLHRLLTRRFRQL